MKILGIYCDSFNYIISEKSLNDSDNDYLTELSEEEKERLFTDSQLAFIQVEKHDEDNPKSIEKKLLNFLKWLARNNKTKKIILHSFAHLSESKADAKFTKELFNKVEKRLIGADYQASQTPFGYFLDLNISAPGKSMARVFKSF